MPANRNQLCQKIRIIELESLFDFNNEIINLIEGKQIGGIAVQMYFWAKIFAQNGWQVFSFKENAKHTEEKEAVVFKPQKSVQSINALLEWWYAFYYLLRIRPDVVIYRGANRALFPLSVFSKLFGVKLVMFGASDVNFEPGKELVGSKFNRKCYQKAIKRIRLFVTQNKHQHDTLLNNYDKESITLFNIWGEVVQEPDKMVPSSDAVWVANFRKLKRAEWVIEAAKQCPEYRFAMAGGGFDEYYKEMQTQAQCVVNLDFLGPKSFFFTNSLVQQSKVLLCTSTFEGFPNTFLQAWSNGIPVISTVDPSNIIDDNNIGVIIVKEEDLPEAIRKVLEDKEYYKKLQNSIVKFFNKNHSSQSGYDKLMKYIYG